MLKLALALLASTALALPATAQECDRDCLVDLADDYTNTFVTGDASGIGLEADAVIVENLAMIDPGEGL